MTSISARRVLRLLPFLLPAALWAQEPSSVDSGLVEEEIPVIGFSIQRKDSTTGQNKEPNRTAPTGTPGRNAPAPKAAAPAAGQWRDPDTPAPERPRLRRVMISLGGGEEPIRDLKEPPFPVGLDAPYDWDTRILIRLNGLSTRLQLRDRLGFKQFTLNGHLRVDPFVRTGLGHARDEVFDWANKNSPTDNQGFVLGFQATRNEFWGFSADYEKLDVYAEGEQTVDLITSVGAGYSPLGANKGKLWNYSLNSSVNYEDIHYTAFGVRRHEAGVGFGFGPVFQYGLEWVPIPFINERTRLRKKIKFTRVRLRATYGESSIHPASSSVQADIVAYATRWVRLTAGMEQVYLPGSGNWRLNNKVQCDIIVHFLAVKY